MLTHAQIWNAIDALAARHGLSASGLARKARLDATTFNKSKRTTPDGRSRWPSTESVAKVLEATGDTVEAFMMLLMDRKPIGPRQIPVIGFAEAGAGGFFDDAGFPAGAGWDEAVFPGIGDDPVYALEVSGESMQPLYRDGDMIIVSPAAQIRKGDRVVVKTQGGEVMVKELKRRTAKTIELASMNPAHGDRILQQTDIVWMARIVWASQ